jgi:precorrin-6x reductase
LAIPVVMVERREIARHPDSETVASVDAAVAWIGLQIARSHRTGESSATIGDSA